MQLSKWVQEIGSIYHAAWKMYKAGKVPHTTEQFLKGTIIVYPKEDKILYVDVCMADDLHVSVR